VDSVQIRRLLSARRLKVTAKDKRVERAAEDSSVRVRVIDAKWAELQNRRAA